MPERRMGMAVGQDPELLATICGWANAAATRPVWAKMTPNITDITVPARAALDAGARKGRGILCVARGDWPPRGFISRRTARSRSGLAAQREAEGMLGHCKRCCCCRW